MGKLLPFRRPPRKRRWTQFSDGLKRQPRMTASRPRKTSWREAFVSVRVWILLIFFAAAIAIWRVPELVGVPDILATEPVRVDARFTRCGYGRGPYCVIDGDTVKVGQRSIRVMGFDAPELKARCEREGELAEAATRALQDWLNAGPFWMRGRWDDPVDRYGRGLHEFYRRDESGREVYVGDALVKAGLARRYYGGGREGWCG